MYSNFENDHPVIITYEDQESDGRLARSDFQAMMRDVALRRFDGLLFWSLDRLTREGALPTLQHLTTLSGYGVGYRSFTGPYLDSYGAFKDAIIAILGAIGRQERLRISGRVKAGLDRVWLKGTRSGRPIGRLRVVLDWQRVIELRAAQWSWQRIARGQGISVAAARRACAFQRDCEPDQTCQTAC